MPTKIALRFVGPLMFAFLRTVPGSLLLLVLLVALRKPFWPRAVAMTALVGLLQTGGFIGLTTAALVSGGAGKTAILANTWQFWILVLAWPILGERLKSLQWATVALGLGGLVLIIQPWLLNSATSSLLALGGAVSYAFGSIAVKLLRQQHNVDLLSLTAWQSFFGSLPLLIVALLFDRNWPELGLTFGLCLGYAIVAVTCLGSFLWLYALRELPAGIAGLGTIAAPVVGILASWAQLSEQPTVLEGVGMALVIVAMIFLYLSTARPRSQWREIGKEGLGR